MLIVSISGRIARELSLSSVSRSYGRSAAVRHPVGNRNGHGGRCGQSVGSMKNSRWEVQPQLSVDLSHSRILDVSHIYERSRRTPTTTNDMTRNSLHRYPAKTRTKGHEGTRKVLKTETSELGFQ